MSKSFPVLFYWKWRTAFYKAVGRRAVYEELRLLQKLREALFFETLEAEVAPSYRFWVRVEQTLANFPWFLDESLFEDEVDELLNSRGKYLRECLNDVLIYFQDLPQVFIDLSRFYPRFNLRFEEIEFVYLDFWSQTPKVIDSLRVEFLVRGEPEPLEALWWAWGEEVSPPWKVGSPEEMFSLMRSYFIKHERYPIFVEILTLYLKARPQIREECLTGLLKIHPEVTEAALDEALAQYFIMYYIFKGVSSETLRFCAWYAAPGKEAVFQDPFKQERDYFIIEWEGYTEVQRQAYIKRKQARWEAQKAEFEKKRPAWEAAFAYVKALNDESRKE